MNGALTFCLPVIFIDFFLFKNIKVTNKKYDIFEHSYAYSNYLEDKDRTIVIKNFLIQNNININQELINILNSIHFQYAKEEYSSIQQNIDDYFRDNIFYSTYNFLVELFFKSKDKNILNLFFINAFDSDHCYPYQKRNLTDFLFLLEEKALSFTDCFKDDKKIDETVLSKFVFYKNFYENTKTDKEILNIIVADFNKETLNAIKNDYIHLGYNGTYVNTNGYFSIKNKHNDNLSGNLNNSNLELYNFFNKVLINSEILESEEVINKKQAESDFLKNLCQEFYKKNKDLNLKELLTNFKNTKDYKDNFYKKIPDVTILGFFRQFNKSQQIKN